MSPTTSALLHQLYPDHSPLGFFVSIVVILVTQNSMSKEDFSTYGWRIPFLISIILVMISLYIRLKMKSRRSSPAQSHGMTSTQRLKTPSQVADLKNVLISLFGATAGQGVVCIRAVLRLVLYADRSKVNLKTANIVVAIALLLGMPFSHRSRCTSDRIGRKELMMAGLPAGGPYLHSDLQGRNTLRAIM